MHRDTIIASAGSGAGWIHLGHLAFDAAIILYAEFILYSLIAGGAPLIMLAGGSGIFAVAALADFFVLWYVGSVCAGYRRYGTKDEDYRILVTAGLALIAIWIVISLHFGVFFNLYDIYKERIEIGQIFTMPIVIFMGLVTGIIFGVTEVDRVEGRPFFDRRIKTLRVTLSIVFSVAAMHIVYHSFGAIRANSIPLGIGAWALVSAIGCIAISRILKMIRDRAGRDESSSAVKRFDPFHSIVFPLIAITALCVLDEIYILGKILPAKRDGQEVSRIGMFLYLFFTGIIPIRIMMAFEPPFRIVNAVFGAGAVGYFIYSVLSKVPG